MSRSTHVRYIAHKKLHPLRSDGLLWEEEQKAPLGREGRYSLEYEIFLHPKSIKGPRSRRESEAR